MPRNLQSRRQPRRPRPSRDLKFTITRKVVPGHGLNMMKRWVFIFALALTPLLASTAGAQSPTTAPAGTTAPSGGDQITPLIQGFMKPADVAQGDDALH